MRLISQLMERFLQKLLIYLYGTIILTFLIPLFPVELIIFCLNLHEALLLGKLSRVLASVKAGLFL